MPCPLVASQPAMKGPPASSAMAGRAVESRYRDQGYGYVDDDEHDQFGNKAWTAVAEERRGDKATDHPQRDRHKNAQQRNPH